MIIKDKINEVISGFKSGINEGIGYHNTLSILLSNSNRNICENVYCTLNEANINSLNCSSLLEDILIKKGIFEELNLIGTRQYFNFLLESLDKLVKNEQNVLLEDSGNMAANIGGELATTNLFTAAGEGGSLAYHGIKNKIAKKAGKKVIEKTSQELVKDFGKKGIIKLFTKMFPKLAAKWAPKLAKMGVKACRVSLCGITLGVWVLVEIVLAIISYGGLAFLKSNWPWAKALIKKCVEYLKTKPQWVKYINMVWNFVGYGDDVVETILKRGIELGYISKKRAMKIDNDISWFGAGDYDDVQEKEKVSKDNTFYANTGTSNIHGNNQYDSANSNRNVGGMLMAKKWNDNLAVAESKSINKLKALIREEVNKSIINYNQLGII